MVIVKVAKTPLTSVRWIDTPEVVLITTPAYLMTNPSGNGKECQKSGSSLGCDEEYQG